MLIIRNRQSTPPRGWDSLQPDGTLIKAGDLGELILKVFNYRVARGESTADVAEWVEDEICRRKPIKCSPPRPLPDGSKRKLGVADVWRFVKTLDAWLSNGTLVTQEEAERRAEICAGCRFNQDVNDGSCWGCTSVIGMVGRIIGDKKTKLDHALKNCAVCGCFNALAVWVPLPVLQKASGALEYPEDTDGRGTICWKRTPDAAP